MSPIEDSEAPQAHFLTQLTCNTTGANANTGNYTSTGANANARNHASTGA